VDLTRQVGKIHGLEVLGPSENHTFCPHETGREERISVTSSPCLSITSIPAASCALLDAKMTTISSHRSVVQHAPSGFGASASTNEIPRVCELASVKVPCFEIGSVACI
jgi:hypothetical protein